MTIYRKFLRTKLKLDMEKNKSQGDKSQMVMVVRTIFLQSGVDFQA